MCPEPRTWPLKHVQYSGQRVLLGTWEPGWHEGSTLPAWGEFPSAHVPPQDLLSTPPPTVSPVTGVWRFRTPFRAEHSWCNGPKCQSRVSVCPRTHQCHVPPHRQRASKTSLSRCWRLQDVSALLAFVLILWPWALSLCSSGAPNVQLCFRPEEVAVVAATEHSVYPKFFHTWFHFLP